MKVLDPAKHSGFTQIVQLHATHLFLLSLCVCVYACAKSFQSCLTLSQLHGLQPTRLLCPWDSPDKNTGVGWHAFLQGIFPTHGSIPHLLGLPTLAGELFTTSATWEAKALYYLYELSIIDVDINTNIEAGVFCLLQSFCLLIFLLPLHFGSHWSTMTPSANLLQTTSASQSL